MFVESMEAAVRLRLAMLARLAARILIADWLLWRFLPAILKLPPENMRFIYQ